MQSVDQTPARRAPSTRLFSLAALGLLCVALLQLLPQLGLVDFHYEEGRRVLPAREMLTTGQYLVPTLWGVPYLSKPPGIYWALALIFEWTGGTSEVAARSLALCSSATCALLLLWIGRRMVGLRAGLYAGLLFLVAVETQAKGRLAEIEAPLALAVLLAVGAACLAREGRSVWWTVAGLGLACALLLKGPAALLYFLSAPVLMALVHKRPGELLRPGMGWALLLGLGIPGLWAWKLFETLGTQTVLEHWGGELGGQGGRSLSLFLSERGKYLVGSALAFAPALWILLAALRTPLTRRWRSESALAVPLWTALGGWLFFLVFPGTSVRYLSPAFPFVCLLAGEALSRAQREPGTRLAARLSLLARGLAWLGLLPATALVVAYWMPLGDFRSDGWGLCLGFSLAVTCGLIWKWRDARAWPCAFVAIPLLIGQVYVTQLERGRAQRQARRIHAAAMDAQLPEDAILHAALWANFNTLFYVEHEVRYEPDLANLQPGDWVFAEASRGPKLERARPGTRQVLALTIHGHELGLFQLGAVTGR